MARALVLREPTEEERAALEWLIHARTRAARLVERAHQVVWTVLHGERVDTIAPRVHVSAATVYLWLHRFSEAGVAGLEDRQRKGHPRRIRPSR